jgi:hypothetical protein
MLDLTPLQLALGGAVLIILALVLEYRKTPEQVFQHYKRVLETGDGWSWTEVPLGLGIGCLLIAALMALGFT